MITRRGFPGLTRPGDGVFHTWGTVHRAQRARPDGGSLAVRRARGTPRYTVAAADAAVRDGPVGMSARPRRPGERGGRDERDDHLRRGERGDEAGVPGPGFGAVGALPARG